MLVEPFILNLKLRWPPNLSLSCSKTNKFLVFCAITKDKIISFPDFKPAFMDLELDFICELNPNRSHLISYLARNLKFIMKVPPPSVNPVNQSSKELSFENLSQELELHQRSRTTFVNLKTDLSFHFFKASAISSVK